MAAATNHSPRNSGSRAASLVLNSPQSKRAAARGSPWTQVVREAEPEAIVLSSAPSATSAVAAAAAVPSSPSASANAQVQMSNSFSDWSSLKETAASSSSSSLSLPDDSAVEAQPETSDDATGSGNAAKKPVWKRPSNGAAEIGPVMGAVSWPPLSESTRASPKSSSDSLKALSDGSVSTTQESGIASSSSQKQVITNNTNSTLTPNHVTPTRQKSMKRGGGSSGGSVTANGGIPQLPQPLGPVVEIPSNNAGKPVSAVPEPSSKEHTPKESGQRGGFGSQSHSGNDHPQQRNSFRRGNGGPHARGDGSYHHNYGGRRDQDRANHDWNSHRSFNGRDAHVQAQRVVPRGFIRTPPHSPTAFIPPPPVPVRPFGNPMVYPEASQVIYVPVPPPDALRGVPIVAPISPHAMFFPAFDPQLQIKIINQIDYYFSNENLIKDTFLRQNMDEHGWVPIKLIAGFKKVMFLTDNIQLILDALRNSNVVEVQGDKVRKRNDWGRWIMPPAGQFSTVSSPQSLGRSSHDMLTTNFQGVSLEDKQGQTTEAFLSRSLSGDLNSPSQPSSSEGTGHATAQAGSERSISARSSSK